MIIQCPYCATRYELDAARLSGPNPMFKCSRCRHIFPAPSAGQPTAAPAAASGRAKSNPPSEENLKLPFAAAPGKKQPEPTAGDDLSIPEADDDFTLGTETHADELTVPDVDAEPEMPAVLPPTTLADAEEPDEPHEMDVEQLTHDDDESEIEAEAPKRPRRTRTPPRRERSHVIPLFVFLALVVTGYGVLTSTLFANPALSEKLIGRIPLIGTLGDERLLVRKVALSDVVGSYQRIKDGKDVFVITGKALNTAPVALQGVQIAGKLFDNAGGPLDQKVISCGNVISTKVLKDLTPQEVSILQKLSPPKKFVIEPGESSTFVIVFMDPPRQAVEFTTQVVAAQRQA